MEVARCPGAAMRAARCPGAVLSARWPLVEWKEGWLLGEGLRWAPGRLPAAGKLPAAISW